MNAALQSNRAELFDGRYGTGSGSDRVSEACASARAPYITELLIHEPEPTLDPRLMYVSFAYYPVLFYAYRRNLI